MPSDNKTSVMLPVAVTLAALYVGAYYAMVEPLNWYEYFGIPPAKPHPLQPEYYVGNRDVTSRFKTFFLPIHWLDRRIRTRLWEDADRHHELNEAYRIPHR